MGKRSAKRKLLRGKVKRYAAAAVAGAALLSGAALPGIPVAKAAAAEPPAVSPSIQTQQTQTDTAVIPELKTNFNFERGTRPERYGWHQHKYDWPGPDENQGLYVNWRIYYRSDSDSYRLARYLNGPLDFLREHAARYGFDRYEDSFTILSQSKNKATVEVIKHDSDQRYIIDLERDYDYDWTVVSIHIF